MSAVSPSTPFKGRSAERKNKLGEVYSDRSYSVKYLPNIHTVVPSSLFPMVLYRITHDNIEKWMMVNGQRVDNAAARCG